MSTIEEIGGRVSPGISRRSCGVLVALCSIPPRLTRKLHGQCSYDPVVHDEGNIPARLAGWAHALPVCEAVGHQGRYNVGRLYNPALLKQGGRRTDSLLNPEVASNALRCGGPARHFSPSIIVILHANVSLIHPWIA